MTDVVTRAEASRLGALYARAYDALCGRHPRVRPWHFQWLAVKDLYRDLRRSLPELRGRVLDVGCGEKPYARWLSGATECVGIDVVAGRNVDVVITPGQPWPLESRSFDAVLCTQVIEHAQDLDNVLAEIHRVLAPKGLLLLTVPFAYNEHGAPGDYRRLSVHGVRELLSPRYAALVLTPQGGIGSTTGLLVLNWIEATLNRSRTSRVLKAVLLPLWLIASAAVNMGGWALDRVDHTNAFYSNVLVLARKKE